jgi:hypothetical protein
MGEMAAAKRLLEEFGRRGHECCICDEKTQQLLEKINPSFALSLCPKITPPKNVPSALVLSRPNKFTAICTAEEILRYDNILHCTPDIRNLELLAAKKGKCLRSMQFHYSIGRTDFSANPKRRLFYGGVCHDSRRGSSYGKLYRLLDGTNYFDVYGVANLWKERTPNSYRGLVYWDGGALLRVMRDAGVSLVLHSDDHLVGATVSPRIFEAAAAANVIICDKHPFVIEHFGDSVLYVNQEAGPEEMFRQIDGHMEWILNNQQQAIDLARRSHRIFTENFLSKGKWIGLKPSWANSLRITSPDPPAAPLPAVRCRSALAGHRAEWECPIC